MNVVFIYGKANKKESEKQNINIRVYHSSFDFRRTTGLEISCKDWDFAKKQITFNGSKSPDERRYLQSVKEKLVNIVTTFEREFLELKIDNKLRSFNNTSWNEWCENTLNEGLGIVEEEVKEEIPLLVEAFEEFIQLKETDYAQNTMKGLKSNLNVLKCFLSYNELIEKFKLTDEQKKEWSKWYTQSYGRNRSNELRFNETDLKFHRLFREWNKKRGNNDNYFYKIIGNLKIVLHYFNSVSSEKYPIHDNVRHKDFKSDKLSRPHSVLSEEELKRVFNFQGNERLMNVSSLAKILYHGCFRYNELKQELKRKENGTLEIVKRVVEGQEVEYWNIYQGKTDIQKKIPMNATLKEALFDPSFHRIESQNFNEYLKELLQLLAIVKEYKITSHTFRRSFITNMVNKGYSPSSIMEYSGHKTEVQFREYCRKENIELKTLNPIYAE